MSASASTAEAKRIPPGLNPWKPGQSGNPKGRAPSLVDIAALAREHGPRCIEVAVGLLDDPDSKVRLAALIALLDRGFGRPTQTIAAEDGTSPVMLHLLAVREIGRELTAERNAAGPPTIQHETLTNSAPDSIDAPALE